MKKGKHTSDLGLQIITYTLILLWVPVTIDKFWSLGEFHASLLNQPFPNWWADILYLVLPAFELSIVILLVWAKGHFRHLGMLLSTVLLIVFTTYIALGLLDVFEQRPCGCGSVIKNMTWDQHFLFNLFFLFLNALGLYLWYKQRDGKAGSDAIKGWSAKRHINYSLTPKI